MTLTDSSTLTGYSGLAPDITVMGMNTFAVGCGWATITRSPGRTFDGMQLDLLLPNAAFGPTSARYFHGPVPRMQYPHQTSRSAPPILTGLRPFATDHQEHLPARSKVYVELSDEFWNFAQFGLLSGKCKSRPCGAMRTTIHGR